MKRTKQIDISQALALSGTFSFLCSCSKASLLPFLTLYFRHLGLSPAMTGVVMGTQHCITLVWSPLSALLCRHYNKRRVVISCSLVLSALIALLLLLVPPTDVSGSRFCNASNLRVEPNDSLAEELQVTRAGPQSWTTVHLKAPVSWTNTSVTRSEALPRQNATKEPQAQPSAQNTPVLLSSVTNPTRNSSALHSSINSSAEPLRLKRSEFISSKPEEKKRVSLDFLTSLKEMDVQTQLFFLLLFIVSAWEFVAAPLEWVVDDGLFEYLDFADMSDRHSSRELWALLGGAFGVGVSGLLVSQLSCVLAAETPRSAAHFYTYAGLAGVALPAAVYHPLYLNRKRQRAGGLLKAVQLVQGSPRALLCALTVFLVGAAGSAVDNFLLWQMQDHCSSELHMGLSLSLALLSQAAFPLLAGWALKLLSPGRILVVGAASLGLQCFYYSFLWGAWAALPAQVLSCFSKGALWWAVRVHCGDLAVPGAERSVRRVYMSLALPLGSGVGSFAGGFVAQRFGLTWLFRSVAVGLMAWCTCLPLLQWRAPQQRRINYSRLLAADGSDATDSESEQERDWLDKAMEEDRSNNNSRRTSH